MLPLTVREDLGAMAMKGYSAFPKDPALLEPHHQIVCGMVLLLCREAVGVFYSSSRLGNVFAVIRRYIYIYIYSNNLLIYVRICV